MKLTLPSTAGGFGLKGMELNSEIALSKGAQEICGKQRCYADMLFAGAKLVLEYNGREYHRGKEAEDELRRLALAHDGYRVETVTYEQLTSRSAMKELADSASIEATGRSARTRSTKWESASHQLYATLKNGAHVSNSATWRYTEQTP